MNKIQFGTLRSIEVFQKDTDKELILQWKNFVERIIFKGKTPEFQIEIFGTVNEMHPITIRINDGSIFVYDAIADSNVLIAKSEVEFYTIISDILEIWKPNAHIPILTRDENIMNQFRAFTKKLEQITDIDINWWVNFAFKELNFRFIM